MTKEEQKQAIERLLNDKQNPLLWSKLVDDMANQIGRDRIKEIEENAEQVMTPEELGCWREQLEIVEDLQPAMEQLRVFGDLDEMSRSDRVKFFTMHADYGRAMRVRLEVIRKVSSRTREQ